MPQKKAHVVGWEGVGVLLHCLHWALSYSSAKDLSFVSTPVFGSKNHNKYCMCESRLTGSTVCNWGIPLEIMVQEKRQINNDCHCIKCQWRPTLYSNGCGMWCWNICNKEAHNCGQYGVIQGRDLSYPHNSDIGITHHPRGQVMTTQLDRSGTNLAYLALEV